MAGENSFGGYDFGVTHSSTVASTEVDDFLNGGETKPIPKTSKKTQPSQGEEEESKEETKEEKKPAFKSGPIDFADLTGDEDEDQEESEDTEEEGNEDEDEDQDDPKEDKKKKPEGSVFEDISQELFTLGIFTSDDEEDEVLPSTPEEFAARWDIEAKKKVGTMFERWLASKKPEAREFFQEVMINEVDPISFLQSHVRLQDIANLDITVESNQERIVEELYRQNGKKDPKAAVQKLKDYGDLETEAQEAKEILSQREEENIKAQVDKVKADNQRKAQEKAHYYQSVNRILSDKLIKKEFDGIPVNRQFAESIQGYITQDKYQNSAGEYLTEFDNDILLLRKPENYELKVKMAMLLKMVKEDPSLSKIKKTAVSKETNTLFNKVAERVSKAEKTAPNKNRWS